jgi:ankyrin repeat protein
LSLLLEHGSDVDGRGVVDQTPLHRASQKGNPEAGLLLLDHGADLNARNGVGCTPLISAVYYERVEFVRMLLERGARINDHGNYAGQTPLHFAVKWTWFDGARKIQLVRLLLEHGADINVRDKSGKTPPRLSTRNNKRLWIFYLNMVPSL